MQNGLKHGATNADVQHSAENEEETTDASICGTTGKQNALKENR